MRSFINISLVFITLVFIGSCKPEVDLNTFTTDLKIIVRDQDGALATGVNVILFDNEAQYQANAPTNSAAGSIATGVTDGNGEITFANLSHESSYWIHIYFIDGMGFQQSNLSGQYALLNALTEGSVTTVEIDLSQDGVGEVALWTDGSNTNNLGIEFFIEDQSQGTLNATRGSDPTPSDNANSLVSGSFIAGTYPWYAKGQNGCVWQGEVTIVEDTLIPIYLSECNSGSVTFWSQADLTAEGSISIVIDQDNPIGTLTTTIGAAPTACFEPGTVSTSLPEGTHLYHAVSASGNCLWTNSFTITEDDCTIIELMDCE